MKGILHSLTTKSVDSCRKQVLPHQTYGTKYVIAALAIVCASVAGLSPFAILLPLSMATSALLPTRPSPSHVLWLPLPYSRFFFSPVSKNKILLAASGTDPN